MKRLETIPEAAACPSTFWAQNKFKWSKKESLRWRFSRSSLLRLLVETSEKKRREPTRREREERVCGSVFRPRIRFVTLTPCSFSIPAEVGSKWAVVIPTGCAFFYTRGVGSLGARILWTQRTHDARLRQRSLEPPLLASSGEGPRFACVPCGSPPGLRGEGKIDAGWTELNSVVSVP